MEHYAYDKKNGLWYKLEGDYYIPCVTVPEVTLTGIWGERRRHFLKNHQKALYIGMMLDDALEAHLQEINTSAEQMFDQLVRAMAEDEKQTEVERNHILDFHVRFEEIFPFEDGNGRVGRLLMFKECLRHDVMPFIIDDKRRSRYLRGIKEWHDDRYELVDVVMEAQDRFEAQIELQKLYAHTRLYLPTDYKED